MASDEVWATSDFAYMCLRDKVRTEALRAAIEEVVRPGDVVLDIGSGTGILSLFAAAAGASRVVAVEQDRDLCSRLVNTVACNELDQTIEVVQGDARTVDLPKGVDVVVAEVIDTWLLDESFVDIHNRLLKDGIARTTTRMIPRAYRLGAQLLAVSDDFYGFRMDVLRHEWSFYSGSDWIDVSSEPRSAAADVTTLRFGKTMIEPTLSVPVRFEQLSGSANALCLFGTLELSSSVSIGSLPALNGNKIVPIKLPQVAGPVVGTLIGRFGAGLQSVAVSWGG